jgi:hypothetical protein
MRTRIRDFVPRAGLLASLFLALGLAPAAKAGMGDGMVIGATKILDNGDAADRYDVVLVAEGYTQAQLDAGLFETHANEFLEFMQATPPFSTHCSALNVWRLDVKSDESGADDPTDPDPDFCSGATGASVDTYFDATFCSDGEARRLLGVDSGLVQNELNANVPGWEQGIVIVNTSIYGGAGGSVGTTSVSGNWERIAIHEWGHSGFGLADEYEYYLGCGIDTDRDMHPGPEPAAVNVTLDANAVGKWSGMLEVATPTTSNADCTICDPQADPFPGSQVVGTYEGAGYYHCDSFRPVFSCMMRNFKPFCPVCTDRILDVLAPYEPPNSAPLCDAGAPIVAECNGAATPVMLDGSASSDPDCDPMTLSWTGGFAGGMAEGVMPTVDFAGTGVFPIDLVVSDGEDMSMCMTQVTVQDTLPPSLTPPADVFAECAGPGGAAVDIGTPIVSDICDPMVTVGNDAPAIFPLGDTIVTWTATDDSGNVTQAMQTVTVADTTPPTLSLSLDPDSIWPPNHRLHHIEAAIEVDDVCDPDPSVVLDFVTSSEPDDGRGDGRTLGDVRGAITGTEDLEFRVRAERDGRGSGRTYTAQYTASDDSGNATSAQDTVEVAHDRR